MGIISVIQVLIKQTADGLGAVIAHIRRLVFYWAWCIHKVRTQLIAADTLPAMYAISLKVRCSFNPF